MAGLTQELTGKIALEGVVIVLGTWSFQWPATFHTPPFSRNIPLQGRSESGPVGTHYSYGEEIDIIGYFPYAPPFHELIDQAATPRYISFIKLGRLIIQAWQVRITLSYPFILKQAAGNRTQKEAKRIYILVQKCSNLIIAVIQVSLPTEFNPALYT